MEMSHSIIGFATTNCGGQEEEDDLKLRSTKKVKDKEIAGNDPPNLSIDMNFQQKNQDQGMNFMQTNSPSYKNMVTRECMMECEAKNDQQRHAEDFWEIKARK